MTDIQFRRSGNLTQVRITRESTDEWCFDELRSAVMSSWIWTGSAGSTSTGTARGTSRSWDASSETVTLGVTTTDTGLRDIAFYTGSPPTNDNRDLTFRWSRQQAVERNPSNPGLWNDAPNPSTEDVREAVWCPPEVSISASETEVVVGTRVTITARWARAVDHPTNNYRAGALLLGLGWTNWTTDRVSGTRSRTVVSDTVQSHRFGFSVWDGSAWVAAYVTVNWVEAPEPSGAFTVSNLNPTVGEEVTLSFNWDNVPDDPNRRFRISLVRNTPLPRSNIVTSDASSGNRTWRVRYSDPTTSSWTFFYWNGTNFTTITHIITWGAANQPPVLDDLPARTVAVGSTLNFDISDYISDPDADSVRIAAVASNTRISMTVNATAHTFAIRGRLAGTTEVTVTPTDEHGLAGTAKSFTVTVTSVAQPNRPPELSQPGEITVILNQSISVDYTSLLSDPDNDVITIAATESSNRFTITSVNSRLHQITVRGDRVGSGTMTVTPTDDHGLSGTARDVTVNVVEEEENDPPVWDLPAAFNVVVDDDADVDLDNYCSDPDGDSLTYTATENDTDFSISLDGSILTINGGSRHMVPAGTISLIASDGHNDAVAAEATVNVIDTSINNPPVLINLPANPITVVIDGRGRPASVTFRRQFTATDPNGDRIDRWEFDDWTIPGTWREDSGVLSVSSTPNAEQTGYVGGSAVQDYYASGRGRDVNTIWAPFQTPQYMQRSGQYRVRCRDARQMYSNWEIAGTLTIVQAVHGTRVGLDTFSEEPDNRQPNIWAFNKKNTSSVRAGGVHYQYATPDEARADKEGWAGEIVYNAGGLYKHISGERPSPSAQVVFGIRNVHPSLNAVRSGNSVTFTPKADAPENDTGSYSRFRNWDTLCEVSIDDGRTRGLTVWRAVTGFIFITNGEPEAKPFYWNSRLIKKLYWNSREVKKMYFDDTLAHHIR